MKQQQTGASLIEAMIAMVIVGFGLLGVGSMQSLAIAMNQSAYYRGVAADLGSDLAERVRALRSPFLAGTGTASSPPAPPDFSKCVQNADIDTTCAAQTNTSTYGALLKTEMDTWNSLRIAQMPAGSSYTLSAIAVGNYYRYTLTLTWADNRRDNTTASYSVVIE